MAHSAPQNYDFRQNFLILQGEGEDQAQGPPKYDPCERLKLNGGSRFNRELEALER